MADISQLEVNGTTYDICDATARDSLTQYCFNSQPISLTDHSIGIGCAAPESGLEIEFDTTFNDRARFLGSYALDARSTTMRDGVTPASGTEFSHLRWLDSSGATIGRINPWFQSNGNQSMRFISQRNINSTSYFNTLSLGLDSSGNATINIGGTGAAAAWRNAIEAFSSSGGTITNDSIYLKSTSINPSVTPSSVLYAGVFGFRDKNNNGIGYLQSSQTTSNALRTMMYATRVINGSSVYSGLGTEVRSDGSQHFFCTSAANFRSDLGIFGTGGGTLSGSVIIKSSNINRDTSNPSADQWGQSLNFNDADNENLGGIVPSRRSTGQISVGLYAYNEKTDGTQVNNGIVVYVARDATCVYSVSSPTAFRSAIGAAASSDRRLKEDISLLGDEAVSFVEDLEPVVYTINGERQVGFIAQDVDAADPWGTNMAFESQEGLDGLDDWERMPDGSSTWKLDYIRTIPPIAAALKQAMKRIDQLEERVSELESMLGGSNAQ